MSQTLQDDLNCAIDLALPVDVDLDPKQMRRVVEAVERVYAKRDPDAHKDTASTEPDLDAPMPIILGHYYQEKDSDVKFPMLRVTGANEDEDWIEASGPDYGFNPYRYTFKQFHDWFFYIGPPPADTPPTCSMATPAPGALAQPNPGASLAALPPAEWTFRMEVVKSAFAGLLANSENNHILKEALATSAIDLADALIAELEKS